MGMGGGGSTQVVYYVPTTQGGSGGSGGDASASASEAQKEQIADWVVTCLLGPFASLYVLGFTTKVTLDRFLKGSWTTHGEDIMPKGGIKQQSRGTESHGQDHRRV